MVMPGYIARLKADTARAEADRLREEALVKRPAADPRLTENWKPLTDQITEIWLNLPCDLRNRPILISELIPQLRSRYNAGKPSAGNVGQALRSLKFTSVRDWRSGRRRWLPSQDIL
jgi:hypothetical protein